MEKVRDFSKFTGFRVLYFLKFKSQVFDYFKLYETRLTRETNHHVQSFRSDNGSELTSEEFSRFLEKEGIRHESSTPYSPQQKGVAERENRTVYKVGSMPVHAKSVPLYIWAEPGACMFIVSTDRYTQSIFLSR
jgi:hypothetical protein